ncbi:MAG: hypothetical protein L6R42_005601 [Xanthoria sp. 1 TBL-2021]|nr:MAG: hypothetical protein L6R42_005601 [Xanthoria sp. 1 TBL-2021]
MFRSPRQDIARGRRTNLPGDYQRFMIAMYTLFTLLPFGLLFASHIVAIEIRANKSADAAVARCQDITSFDDRDGPDPTCWNTLNMTEQMKNWSVSGPGWLSGYYRALLAFLQKTEAERNTPYSAPDIIKLLNDTPWSNDTALSAVDKTLAGIMENRTDTNGVAALNQTSEDILSYFGSGNFLKLAADGGLLSIDPALVR